MLHRRHINIWFATLALLASTASATTPAAPRPAAPSPAPALLPYLSQSLPPEPPAALIPEHGAASTSFAHSWTGAMVTGNGTMGAMVMGGNLLTMPPRPQEDTLYFSHNRLFLPLDSKPTVPLLGNSLEQMRQTIRTRGYGPAAALLFTDAQQQGFSGMTYPDPFVPAAEFKIKMPASGAPRDYLRTENFQTGEVGIRWTDDAGTYLRRVFISRADNVAVLWIGSAPDVAKPQTVSCEFWIPPVPNIPVRSYQVNNPSAAPADGAANALIQSSSDVDTAGILFHAQYRESRGAGYDVAARIVPTGGTTEVKDGHVLIRDARQVLMLLRIEPFTQITSVSDQVLRQAVAQLPADYDGLLSAHLRIHQTLFDRVQLNLAPPAKRRQTTDALLVQANSPRAGPLDPVLLEKLYEGCRYQLLCSAGTRPPNLQGIWAAPWAPAPSLAGDYAFDASFHLGLSSALSCNTPELMEGLFRLADDSLADWQTNARNLFNARGILVPMHQSSNGLNLLWSDRMPAGLCWTAGAALLAHWYYDYYLYTGDRKFLAQRAVPFMKQAAAFYEDFLFLDTNGKYRFSPSESTNNAPGDNSATDIQAATELLTNLIAACKELHTDAEGITRWQHMLAAMPPLLVAPSGELQEWALPGVSNKPLQRHIPHLYGVYQARTLDPESTPDLWNASRCAFETRFNQWFRPPTLAGETNPQPIQDRLQMGLAAARFGDGKEVGDVLTRIATRNTYPSMMSQRYEDGRTFVADSGGAVPEIFNSALIDSRPGRVDLLPALPPFLPSGEIRGLALRCTQSGDTPSRIIVDSLKWSPASINLELTSTTAQTISFHLPPRASAPQVRTIKLAPNQRTVLHFDLR